MQKRKKRLTNSHFAELGEDTVNHPGFSEDRFPGGPPTEQDDSEVDTPLGQQSCGLDETLSDFVGALSLRHMSLAASHQVEQNPRSR